MVKRTTTVRVDSTIEITKAQLLKLLIEHELISEDFGSDIHDCVFFWGHDYEPEKDDTVIRVHTRSESTYTS